jgi:type IV pilus assembly protein PilM
MALFKSLFGPKRYLGVDIGTTSIKIVEMIRAGAGRTELKNYGFLETYGYLERFNNALQTSSLKVLESEAAAYLKLILNHARIKTREAVAAVPAFAAFTTLIELPVMSSQETEQAMVFQAKQYVPLPISAVKIDWLPVGERTDENGVTKQQIFLISVPNEQIERYKKIFAGAGLNLVALEIEGISLARILTADLKEPALIVDIGARSTSFTVGREGFLKFASQTDFAGGSLTQALASGLNISPRRAEDLKRQKGLLGSGGEYELSSFLLLYLDVIIGEAKRAKNNFEQNYNEKVTSVILSGGGANLLGIEKYFSEQISLPVVKAAPFARVSYPSSIEPIVKELSPAFSVALGLGIKEI